MSPKKKWMSVLLFMLTHFLMLPVPAGSGGAPSLAFAGEGAPPSASAQIAELGNSDREIVEEAVFEMGRSGDPGFLTTLEALRQRSLYVWQNPGGARQVVIAREVVDHEGTEVYPIFEPYGDAPMLDPKGEPLFLPEEALDAIRVGRRLRIQISPMLDRLRLFASDASVRESAATKVGLFGAPEALPMLKKALEGEENRWVKRALKEAVGVIQLVDENPQIRKDAAETLADIHAMDAVLSLEERITPDDSGETEEKDPAVRAVIKEAVQKIRAWEVWTQTAETAFSALSLSSILLMVALGLAITFGLMGVINMAHGELMMLGAYTTYVMQEIFTAYLPSGVQDFYFFLAIPLSFGISALFGLLLEKSIIRKLYGRPLETLLATWGISLILQQGVRQIFGAANVDVASPAWLTGGIRLAAGIQVPYNRLFIVFLSILSVFSVYQLVLRSPIGLKIRAVMQNRQMSACMGITTEWVDAWTFSLGAGLAGMAGAGLTLIGNVGPDLGQNYIVDSFLVVVTGGVGKLAGTVGAAFGIGGLNKLLEPGFGAIYAKVLILLIVILFLQGRPSGLFPAKGRSLDL